MKAIAAALVKAQKEFGPALKTSTNPHFRSRYADLSACIEAVIDALNSNGIYLMQLTDEHDGGVKVSTTFIHHLISAKHHSVEEHEAQEYVTQYVCCFHFVNSC